MSYFNIFVIFTIIALVSGEMYEPYIFEKAPQQKTNEKISMPYSSDEMPQQTEMNVMLTAADGFKISMADVRKALQLASRIDETGLSHNPPLRAAGVPYRGAILSTLPNHELYPKTFDEEDVHYFKDVEFLDDNYFRRKEFDAPIMNPEPLWYYPARG